MSTIYYTHKGEQIHLDKEIGRGGEGPVYSIHGRSSECAKIYSKKLTIEDHSKLLSMVSNPPTDPAYASRKHTSIAWPTSIIYADSKKTQFVGFIMPKIDGKIFRKAFNYLHPSDRRKEFGGGFTWRHLFTTAFNITSAVAAVHERGYCIGDINESNILIAPDALTTLIDCDSFQVKDNTSGKTYRCLVGKPEYTAPELQGKSYKDVDRTVETDSFALAVLIFQIMMEGTHPYQAKGKLVEDAGGTHEKIIKGYFPYTCKLSGIAPPDFAPPFNILHPDMQLLFHRCFVEGHKNPKIRPTAKEWFDVFKSLGSKFKRCSVNENHYYIEYLNNCPWCEIRNKTGNDPFPSPIGQQIALEDPTKSLDSLEKRIDYLRTYIDMALSDGVLTADERDYIIGIGAKLQIPQKEIEKIFNVEIKKSNAKTSSVSVAGTPKLEINDTSFEIINMQHGATASRTFSINNAGGGILSGQITSNKKWLKVAQGNIDTSRHRQEISFQIDITTLDYGVKDTGIIEIQSNGGVERLPVTISIEEDKEAISRIRTGLTIGSSILGALFGYFIYNLNFVEGMNKNVVVIAGMIALNYAVIFGAKLGYKNGGVGTAFGWGFGTSIAGLIIFAILNDYFPPVFSTAAWALIYAAIADIAARSIWYARRRGNKLIPITVGVGTLALTAGIIIGGMLITVEVNKAKVIRLEAGERAKVAQLEAEKKANEAQKKAIQKIVSKLPGEWHGKMDRKNASLFITQEGNQLSGRIIYEDVEESLSINVQFEKNNPVIILKGVSYKRKGGGSFSLDTFYGILSKDAHSVSGNYKDAHGNKGKWSVSRVSGDNIVTKTETPKTTISRPAEESQETEKSKYVFSDLTFFDEKTKLMWTRDANIADKNMTWDDAFKFIKSLNGQKYAGYNDWRLPSKEELKTLVNFAKSKGILQKINEFFNKIGFKNVQANLYWSSTTYADSTGSAWYVGMSSGYMSVSFKTNYYYVLPVRAGQ